MKQKFNQPILLLMILASVAVGVRASQYPKPRSIFKPRTNNTYHPHTQRTATTFFDRWRMRFLEASKKIDTSGLTGSIFLGDDQALDQETIVTFRNAGLSHVLAASGYNCWIVSQIFAILARLALLLSERRRRFESTLRLRQTIEKFAPLFGAVLFFLWSDKSPPILRSVLFVLTKTGLAAINIRGRFLAALTAQYCVMLIINPIYFWSASFQLTFSCLFGLTLVPELPIIRSINKSAISRYFISSTAACLGCIPWTFLFFDEVNFNSIQTNWIAGPIVSFWIMPTTLVAMLFLGPVASELGGELIARGLLSGAALGTRALLYALHIFAEHGISLRF